MTTQTFDIGDILTITTGALVSREHVGGVYKILSFMTGESLFTHQLPRAARECEPELRRQFPDLAEIEAPEWDVIAGGSWDSLNPEEKQVAVYGWLDGLAERYGATREVAPLPAEDHTSIDPVTELRMMRPDAPIIVGEVDTDD